VEHHANALTRVSTHWFPMIGAEDSSTTHTSGVAGRWHTVVVCDGHPADLISVCRCADWGYSVVTTTMQPQVCPKNIGGMFRGVDDQQKDRLELAVTDRLLGVYQRASPDQQERVNSLIDTGYRFAARLYLARFEAEGERSA
jgi:hypothetical protein